MHTRLMREAVRLARITLDTGGYNILPRSAPALIAWNHMIHI